MDFLKNVAKDFDNDKPAEARPEEPGHGEQKHGGGGLFGKITDALDSDKPAGHGQQKPEEGGFFGKINNLVGTVASGEEKEDKLDKAVDWVQEHVLGEGQQSRESVTEQAKDEMISDSIRSGFKNVTGKEFFVSDKEH